MLESKQVHQGLSEFQQDFFTALFSEELGALKSHLKKEEADIQEKRFAVYRNNVFYALSQALSELYPVVKKLVGDDFFRMLSVQFSRTHPPSSAAMVHYGKQFPDFIQHCDLTRTMPWFAEVAEIELLLHQSYHAEDTDTLKISMLMDMSPDVLLDSHIEFAPNVYLFRSTYPAVRIWEANTLETDEIIDLQSGGQCALVYRKDRLVKVETVPASEYSFLAGLSRGLTLGQAFEVADVEHPAQILNRLLMRDIVVAIRSSSLSKSL